MAKASRLIQLIGLLSSGRAYTSTELAERLCISIRTIERDLAELQSEPLYVPLDYHDRERRYFIEAGWKGVKIARDPSP